MKPIFKWGIVGLVCLIALGIFILKKSPEKPSAVQPQSLEEKPAVVHPQSLQEKQIAADQLHSESEADSAICDTLVSSPIPAEAQPEVSAPPKAKILPRMLELGSVGCRPCDMMSPILDELRKEYQDKLSVEFYDVRKDPTPTYQYRIRLIPTQIFLDENGNEFFRHEGYFPKEEIEAVLKQMGVSP